MKLWTARKDCDRRRAKYKHREFVLLERYSVARLWV
jgi:hypothetical protein